MSFDTLITNANLPDGRTGIDIGIREGRISGIAPGLAAAETTRVIDARGRLVSAPFVDCHFHLDATLSLGMNGEYNESGTLAEGIALWARMAPDLTFEGYKERARRYFDIAVSQGLLAVRTHVDVTDPDLVAAKALAEIKEEVADYIDLQLVAFPQMGFFCRDTMGDTIRETLDLGFQVVGGAPHLEKTAELGRASITALCEIAAERGTMVDMHCDENDDPNSRHVETLVYEAERLGLHDRVTGSHLTSMHSMDNFYAARLITRIAASGINVASNPAVNTHLQGRFDTYPKRRGLTRVAELMEAGVTVGFAQDCVLDPWYPLGRAALADVAYIAAHVVHMTSPAGLAAAFGNVTAAPAEIMKLDHLGLAEGASADLLLHEATSPWEVIRLRAAPRIVMRRGQVIAETAPSHPVLSLPGRPSGFDPVTYFQGGDA
ncbi:cytosine deaminase [Marinibacterium profundimaris]|uniref:Cytosine deaminase n=1 Tax=Marinibacterium profundimaris TaxID=1679460 RepID=A0A225NL30_9RHOB|nr:cytosine deaminase [Marinibacterium profundimaris]OWU72662.1 cytosine deaminase [Marinibacterium profundimaris]